MTFDHTVQLPTEEATRAIAAEIAMILRAGDAILLSGEIGAGKSFLCRAILRHVFGEDLEVPSPTFTLVQTYESETAEYWHCDLYRLSQPDEAIELGLDEAFETAICLIEWPDRLGDLKPEKALSIHMSAGNDHHTATFSGCGDWYSRLAPIWNKA